MNKTDVELETIRANLVAGARRKGELSRWLAERAPWDFFLTVFGETHRGGHILWPDRGSDASSSTALLDVYRAVDDAVGHLLDSPTMKDATVILFALHGMGDNISQEHFVPKIVDRLNAAYAGQTPAAEQPESSAPAKAHGQRSFMRLLREKLPAGLQNTIARAVPVGVRDFVVNRSVTGGHDWPTTPGLALLADLHGYFRFNLRGREAAGSIIPGSDEFHRYKEMVRGAFETLKVTGTGAPLVEEIVFTSDAFPGTRSHHLPDVIMSWHVAEQATEIQSAQFGKIQATPATGRSGNHRPHGFASVVNEESRSLEDIRHISHLAGLATRFFD